MTKNTFDFTKLTTDFFAAMPKTPDDAQVAFEKVQSVFKTEVANTQAMWKTYQKATTGDATPNEIAAANKTATEMFKTSTFAGLIAMPGALFVLPLIVEKAREYNIDLVPASVAKEFNI